jgi:carbon starvation protein
MVGALAAMILSVRNQGKSIGYIIEKYISFTGKQLYLTFCCLALILVVAIFAILIAKTFVSSPAVATASLLFILIAVVFGALTHIKVLSFKVASLIFIPIIFLIAIKSASFPLDLTRFGVPQNYVYPIWLTVLFLYAFIASITPVWSLLQPRDYLSSFLLYTMIILGIGGIFISSQKIIIPAFTSFTAPEPINGATQWSLSGTTSKQIDLKRHILPIGYGGMLLEGLLAGITLISVGVYTRSEYFTALYKIGPINAFAGAIARFISNLGLPAQASETFIALTIAAFMMTTLDTATRVTRLTFQELFDFSKNKGKNKFLFLISGFLKAPLTATLIVVALSAYMAFSGEGDKIWPVFGASNQLMAALTLLTITAFFLKTKRKVWVALIPFVIMLIMSCWGLVELFLLNIKASNIPLVVVTSFLLNMTVLLVMQTSIELLCFRKKIVRRKIRSKNTDNLIATGL